MKKDTECSICGNIVSRRKTLRVYKDYRACRIHDGVEDMAKDAQEALQEQYEADRKH